LPKTQLAGNNFSEGSVCDKQFLPMNQSSLKTKKMGEYQPNTLQNSMFWFSPHVMMSPTQMGSLSVKKTH
jgi:hypothetical protein